MTPVKTHWLTRREAQELAGVALGAVDKAIEQGLVSVRRVGKQSMLPTADVGLLALLREIALPLPVQVKRRIAEWVRVTDPQGEVGLDITDALSVYWSSALTRLVAEAEHYVGARDRWIEQRSEVRGGEPVLRGSRIPAQTVAERLGAGESLDDLRKDYPALPEEAFTAAAIYARSHPRRGRPVRLWSEDETPCAGRTGLMPSTP